MLLNVLLMMYGQVGGGGVGFGDFDMPDGSDVECQYLAENGGRQLCPKLV